MHAHRHTDDDFTTQTEAHYAELDTPITEALRELRVQADRPGYSGTGTTSTRMPTRTRNSSVTVAGSNGFTWPPDLDSGMLF